MLIVGFIVLGMIAVALMVFIEYAHDVFPENITVSADGETTSTLPVRDLQLIPTEAREYSVNLVCEASGDYDVFLDFTETSDGQMKHFVDVTVRLNGEQVYKGKLSELLDGEKIIEFECTLEADDPNVITFSYLMPHDTGNEAMGTYADFDTKLTIKKI